ncbi:MAG: hypothetical protein ACI8YQ_002986 [Polaribacter sp.]|jgi:hypothetical protein
MINALVEKKYEKPPKQGTLFYCLVSDYEKNKLLIKAQGF